MSKPIMTLATLAALLGTGCQSTTQPVAPPTQYQTQKPDPAGVTSGPAWIVIQAGGPAASTRPETAGSLRGLDRSHWDRVVVQAQRGSISHSPLYFRDRDLCPKLPSTQPPADPSEPWAEGLRGAVDEPYNARNAAHMLTQPAAFIVDLLWFPWAQFNDPIYENNAHTP